MEERADRLAARIPLHPGRHGERRVVLQERDEAVEIVAFPRAHVAIEQPLRFAAGADRNGGRPCGVALGERFAGALERAVDGRRSPAQQRRSLGRGPAEDVGQDQRRTLARRQLLDGRDECQLHRLPRAVPGLRCRGIVGQLQAVVRERLEPGHLQRRRLGHARRGRAQLVRQHARVCLARRQRIEAGVGRNPVKPRAERAPLPSVEGPPCTHVSVLHRVLRVVQRTEHAVAVDLDLAPQRRGERFELGLAFGKWTGHGAKS